MKPDVTATRILSTTRARAKMHEFRVPAEDYNQLPRDPALLFSLTVGLLGDVSATVSDLAAAEGDGEEEVQDPRPQYWDQADLSPVEALQFTSTFFDAYLNAQLDETVTAELSLLCASAYYLGDAAGSAAVIVRKIESPGAQEVGGLAKALHAVLANQYDFEPPGEHLPPARPVLRALRRFFSLEGSRQEVSEACRELREHCYERGSARELLYADVIAALCTYKVRNSARMVLPRASDLGIDLWRGALTSPRFPTELWPAQQRIAAAGLLKGRSAVIQMPTSAGKTRATELIIRAAFLSRRASLAIIVAPYRSLCHDIRGSLSVAFSGENISINEASESYQPDVSVEELAGQNAVLILTPEKLLYILRRTPELHQAIGLVIYDEGHQFEGLGRGPTYELLLSSLRIALPPETQIVLISAVIGNADQVASWLVGDATAVVGGSGLLPTRKSIAFASWQAQRGRLEYVSPIDPDDQEFFVPRVITDFALQLRPGERAERRFPKDEPGDIALFLGLHLIDNGSVAVFCGRKDTAAKICRRAVEIYARGAALRRPVNVSNAAQIQKLQTLSQLHLGEEAGASQAAGLGIFAHHADTPAGLRLCIEHAMKESHARFVICTSTLAQGVNFPIKYLIVTATQQGREKILVRDFHNLMGRVGRAGMHTEGSVIFSSTAIYDGKAARTGRWRWQDAKRLLNPANAEPCGSAILDLFSTYAEAGAAFVLEIQPQWLDLAFADAARIEAIVDEAAALQPLIKRREFQKFIEERAHAVQRIAAFLVAHIIFQDEEVDQRVQELASSTLAYHLADLDTRAKLIELFRRIGTSIRENADPGAQAVIRRSPVAPSTSTLLQNWLAANAANLMQAVVEDRLADAIRGEVLRHCNRGVFRSLSDRTLLPNALTAWIAGSPYYAVYEQLVAADVRVSNGKPTVEDAVALCESGFGYEAAMIVASMVDLTEAIDPGLHQALAFVQRRVKHGLAAAASIAFFEAGFADRVVAAALGARWPEAVDRGFVRRLCRRQKDDVLAALTEYPAYFETVAQELAA